MLAPRLHPCHWPPQGRLTRPQEGSRQPAAARPLPCARVPGAVQVRPLSASALGQVPLFPSSLMRQLKPQEDSDPPKRRATRCRAMPVLCLTDPPRPHSGPCHSQVLTDACAQPGFGGGGEDTGTIQRQRVRDGRLDPGEPRSAGPSPQCPCAHVADTDHFRPG